MNDIESRLQSAAEETRQFARERAPRQLSGTPAVAMSGWLVFAAAFALVAVTIGLLPLLAGGEDAGPPVGDTPPLSAPVDTQATSATATTTPVGSDTCSADGAALPPDTAGLPGEVAQTVVAIVAAASSCDLDALEELSGDGFTTSFGGGGFDNLAVWEQEGEGKLGVLVDLLGLSHATVDDGRGGQIYVWPAAFAYDSWDEIPQQWIDELRQIFTQEELDQIAGLGVYGGWRTGIGEDGTWMFFVAGD